MTDTTVLLIKVGATILLILWVICGYRIHKQQEYVVWYLRNSWFATVVEGLFAACIALAMLVIIAAIAFAIFYL